MENLKSKPVNNFNYFRPFLTVKRAAVDREKNKRPFYGYWALPGGFMKSEETTSAALSRELLEEAGLDLTKKNITPYQLNVYSNPYRDRYNFDDKKYPGKNSQVISNAFLTILPRSYNPISGTDASDAKFFRVKDVLNKKIEKKVLAFDHNQMLNDAVVFLQDKLTYSTIALDFCDKHFTIADIRHVYQSVWSLNDNNIKVELGNFQNKILKQKDENGRPIIAPLPDNEQKLRKQVGKGAPAKVFKKNSTSKNFSYTMQPTKKR
jgi:ADP-ribose pyrophosphatase YjhB (NUDIX family)